LVKDSPPSVDLLIPDALPTRTTSELNGEAATDVKLLVLRPPAVAIVHVNPKSLETYNPVGLVSEVKAYVLTIDIVLQFIFYLCLIYYRCFTSLGCRWSFA
jgi:hypothetical protein